MKEKNFLCHNQQPLPSILHVAPSLIGRERNPASSGFKVTVPSSNTKQGIPTAPTLFASFNLLVSRMLSNLLRVDQYQ